MRKKILSILSLITCIIAFSFNTFSDTTKNKIRIATRPLPYLRSPKPDEQAAAALARFMKGRLEQCPDIALISNDRSAALFNSICRGKKGKALYDGFNSITPIDYLINYRFTDGKLQFSVISKTKLQTKEFHKKKVRDNVLDAMKFLASTLDLSPREQKTLLEEPIQSPDVFLMYYATRAETSRWPVNTGETRMRRLQPLLRRNKDNIYLHAALLEDMGILVRSKNRDATYVSKGIKLGPVSLPYVLGTSLESKAYEVVRLKPEVFEKDMITIVSRLFTDEVDDLMKLNDDDMLADTEKVVTRLDKAGIKEQCSGIRLLGVMNSEKALPLFKKAASHKNAKIRSAVVTALSCFPKQKNSALLATFSKDKDDAVAFKASYYLWRQSGKPEKSLLTMARKLLKKEGNDEEVVRFGLETIEALGDKADIALLQKYQDDTDAGIRLSAIRKLLKLNVYNKKTQLALQDDHDIAVIIATLQNFPRKGAGKKRVEHALKLANDPLQTISEAAVSALKPYRPEPPRERRLFDLQTEHYYRRLKAIDAIVKAGGAHMSEDLAAAASNPEVYTRTEAMRQLAKHDPVKGEAFLLKGLKDSSGWVRFHAAVDLAKIAKPVDVAAIKDALQTETDAVTKLYLQDALAKAENRPAPKAPAPVYPFPTKRTAAWRCGMGKNALTSPYEGYYLLSTRIGELWKKAHKAGKVCYPRIASVGYDPAYIYFYNRIKPIWWQEIDKEMTPELLEGIDGIIMGEESISFSPNFIWKNAWRIFCLDAGIKPETVNGDMKKLRKEQVMAFNRWSYNRSIDGFNRIYDYIKLKFGKVRPGLQICTFVPAEILHGQKYYADEKRWKFDVGGVYDYKGDNRIACYSMIRRYKTLWPDRPVLWFSLGIGGYEMNPVKRSQKPREQLMFSRGDRAYADSACAYSAGANVGWFSVWIWVKNDFKGKMLNLAGVQFGTEDFWPNKTVFEKAISYGFAGAEKDAEQIKKPVISAKTDIKLEEDEEDLGISIEEDPKVKIRKKIEAKKEKFRIGFNIYRLYLYDCARIFSSLPMLNPKPDILLSRPFVNVWTRPASGNPLSAGLALPDTYDFINDINKVNELELTKYKVIMVYNPWALSDSTIVAITNWLKTTPGLLYVCQNIDPATVAKVSTISDYAGKYTAKWPWAADVKMTPLKPAKVTRNSKLPELSVTDSAGKTLAINGNIRAGLRASANTKILLRTTQQPVLALWQGSGFKGAVLFDTLEYGSPDYLDFLKKTINSLGRKGIGTQLEGHILCNAAKTEDITTFASTGYYSGVKKPFTIPGLDLMGGTNAPKNGPGRFGLITSNSLKGKYVIAINNSVIISETPVKDVKTSANTVEFVGTGLVRISSTRKFRIQNSVPGIDDKDAMKWILFGGKDGIYRMEETGITWLRSKKQPVRISF